MAPMAVRSESWLDLTSSSSNQRTTFSSATSCSSASSSLKNQHLLIRLRQQQFHQNHSNPALFQSSNSINQTRCHLGRPASLLLSEPRKLKSMRAKLTGGSAGRKMRSNSQLSLASSWSSLSGKLSGSLSQLSHTWKTFVYNYTTKTQRAQKPDRTRACSEQPLSRSNAEDDVWPPDEADRNMLTSDWLLRHYTFSSATKINSKQSSRELKSSKKTLPSSSLSSSKSSSSSSSNSLSRSSHSSATTLVAEQTSAQMMLPVDEHHNQPIGANKSPSSNILPVDNQDDYYTDVANANLQDSATFLPTLNPDKMLIPIQNTNILLQQNQADQDYDDYAMPADEGWRLERSQVELVQLIGEGQKGFVFLGKLQSRDGQNIIDVAIKTLKFETSQLIDKLIKEATVMRQFDHPHIIRFIGVCPVSPALIAMELAQFGELRNYLRANKNELENSSLVLFTFQISTALSYLESKQFVHRDVAARNILVCANNCVKLADFGLSRSIQLAPISGAMADINGNHLLNVPPPQYAWYDDPLNEEMDGQYVAISRNKLPVRWLAPESLAFRRFTSASDVWMFAVCTWEIFNFGLKRPWSRIANSQVLTAIEAGQRLNQPTRCPARLYQVMLQCWNYAPIERPKFRDLKQSLWSIYLNERTLEHQQLERERQLETSRRLALLIEHQRRQQHLQKQQQAMLAQSRQQLSPPSPMMQAGYTSECSSSTNTTATVDDSSRSSTMGSLIRQQALRKAAAIRMQQQLNSQAMQCRAQSAAPEQRLIAGGASAGHSSPTNRVANVAQQMNRFAARRDAQRTSSGNVLQKQRSQGSITTNFSPTNKEHRMSNQFEAIRLARPNSSVDDYALLARSKAMRQNPTIQLVPDSDVDESDSDDQREHMASQRRQLKAVLPTKMGRNFALYEGLQRGSSPGKVQRAPNAKLAEDGNDLDEVAKRESKLSSMVQAMQLNPMKARLVNEMRHGFDAISRNFSNNQKSISTQNQQAQDQLDDEQRRLAIHKRLLGHIRPRSIASVQGTSNEHRRPPNLDAAPSRGRSSPVAAPPQADQVDQSLRILESLIGVDKRAAHRAAKS